SHTLHHPPTPPPAIYPLSLHDALPICAVASRLRALDDERVGARALGVACLVGARDRHPRLRSGRADSLDHCAVRAAEGERDDRRSEEHTSELQSPCNLVCRLLLEKKKI